MTRLHTGLVVMILAAAIVLSMVSTAQAVDGISTQIDRPAVGMVLGQRATLTVTVRNESADTSPPLSAHINIIDPITGGWIDPEDWTNDLVRQLDPLAPGETQTLVWSIKPIAAGTFVAYAVVLPAQAGTAGKPLSASSETEINVRSVRATVAYSVLIVATIIPLLIGAIAIGQALSRKRNLAAT